MFLFRHFILTYHKLFCHNICQTCFIQMHDLRRVRQYLTDDAAVLAANALVSSHLDYCNSLFRSLSSFHMHKLQCTQNTLGRIVTNCNRYSRASPILQNIHWLPVKFRCIFKTNFFTVVSQTISVLICLFVAEGMAQDTTFQIRGSSILPICTQSKNTLVTVLLLMLPRSGMICLMMYILLQLLPLSGKIKILYL